MAPFKGFPTARQHFFDKSTVPQNALIAFFMFARLLKVFYGFPSPLAPDQSTPGKIGPPPLRDAFGNKRPVAPARRALMPPELIKHLLDKDSPKLRYVLTSKDKQIPYLKCTACNRKFPLKSNDAIQEEYRRMSGYLEDTRKLSCPNSWCPNHKYEVSDGTQYYYAHSRGRGQAKRYKCRACGRTFSETKATSKQKDSHLNKRIFKDLVIQTSINDICEDCDMALGNWGRTKPTYCNHFL